MKLAANMLITLTILAAAAPALAGKHDKHKVKPGESIAEIARFHGVEQGDLREANDLGDGGKIQPGDVLVIPDRLIDGWTKGHTVKPGDTLAKIARRYKADIDEIKSINRIGKKGRLELGRRLVIPTGKRTGAYEKGPNGGHEKSDGKKPSAKKKKKWDRKATFVRPRDSERKTITIFDKRGRVNKTAQRLISRLARSKKGKVRMLNRRLIALLGEVAKHYPGKEIIIVSGYRPHKRGHRRSQHAKARAIDFKVAGVSNLELYRLIKTFPKVGAGYYPHSTFVHMDVRDRSYAWTDLSGPGEAARYLREGEPGSAENPSAPSAADVGASPSGEDMADPENFSEEDIDSAE